MVNENPWSRKPAWSDEDIAAACEQYELDEMEADEMRAIAEHKEREAELYELRRALHELLCESRRERRKKSDVLVKQMRFHAHAKQAWLNDPDDEQARRDMHAMADQIANTRQKIKMCIAHEASLLDELDRTNALSDLPWGMDLDDIPPQRAA